MSTVKQVNSLDVLCIQWLNFLFYLTMLWEMSKCKRSSEKMFKDFIRTGSNGVQAVFRGFWKLRKATIRFAMPVRQSVRKEWLGFHWRDFHKILCLLIFRKSVDTLQVWLKFDNNNGLYLYTDIHLWKYLAEFSKWQMFQTKVVDKIKRRI
jgi:hypothetical protein